MKHYRNFAVMFLAAALMVMMGCSREAKQTAGVESTTPAGTSTAPPANQAAQQDKAMVRFVNAIPDGERLDAWAGDQKVFTDVGSDAATPYKELPKERVTFKVVRAGQTNANGNTMAENSEGLTAGHHYTVIAMADKDAWNGNEQAHRHERASAKASPTSRPDNSSTADNRAPESAGHNMGTAKLVVIDDNLTPPPDGKARVRVINAAPGGGDVSVVANNIVSRAPNPNGANEPAGSQAAPRGENGQPGNEGSPNNPDTAANNPNASSKYDRGASRSAEEKLFSGVDYASAAGYKDIDPMKASVEIRSDRASTAKNSKHHAPVASASARTTRNMSFEPGKIYTIVVTREPNGRLNALNIEDQFTGAETPANAK